MDGAARRRQRRRGHHLAARSVLDEPDRHLPRRRVLLTAALVVTTCYRPTPAHLDRAGVVALRLGAPLVPRAALDVLFAAHPDAQVLYVVGRLRDEVIGRDGKSGFVQQGLLATKLTTGKRHPFVRAVLGGDDDVCRVVDGTLGLANDALHLATVLGCRVLGVEASPVLFSLLEEGLARLARDQQTAAAAHITVVPGDARDVLAAQAERSADVVVLDPMMSRAKRGAPAFDVVRAFADPRPADAALLEAALRVADRRVVLKLGKGAPLPQQRPYDFEDHVDGAHVRYWVHERLQRRSVGLIEPEGQGKVA